MLVSVVIPTFNRAGLLIGAVESVLAQTHRDLECLVVDDGSWDDTLKALAGVRDNRLKVISQANRGVSAARNAGMAHAQGRILALLDSDDRFLPTKIERQLAFLLKYGYDICHTQEIWIRNGRRVNAMAKHAKPSGIFFSQALETCLVSPSCVMFTRAFWEKVGGFDESLPACEDYDLWLRALPEHPIGLLDQALTIKAGGSGDQLSRLYIGLDLFRLRALMKVLKRADLSLAWKTQAARTLIRKAGVYCRGCQKHGRIEEASRVTAMVRTALAEQGFGTDFSGAAERHAERTD
jgi:glycosyltransferase involved in cell wall biosynthesis